LQKSGNSIHAGDYIFPDIVQEFERRLLKDHHVRFIATSGNNDEERIDFSEHSLTCRERDLKGDFTELTDINRM